MVNISFSSRRKSRKQAGPKTTLFMGICFTLIGSFTMYIFALPNYFKAKESLNWPSTTGKVLVSTVNSKTSRDSEGRSKTMHTPFVEFSYNIDGKEFKSSSISVGESSISYGSYSTAKSIANTYPVGTAVLVYYSPKVRGGGILENGVQNHHYFFLGGMGIFIIVGLLLIKKSRTMKASKDQKHIDELQKNNVKHISKRQNSFKNTEWFIVGVSKDYGPFTHEKLMELYEKGKIKDTHFCYQKGNKGSKTRFAYIRSNRAA